jgi:hypothetical protein
LTRLSPEVRLTDEQYRSVTDMVGAANAAVETTLSLARYPRGRHPISYHGIFAPSMDDFNVYEYVLGPLQLARTHEGDSVAALRVCRATLNVGRSFGDEPDLRLQKVRQYYHAQAIGGLMRLLGQCEATEADLAAFQPALAEEAESDTWALVLRGQRAAAFQALEAVRSGELKPWILRSVTPDPPRSDKPIDAVGEWLDDYFAPDTRPAAAWALRYCTRLLEAAELPWPQRRTAVEALAVERDDSAELAWEILWRVPQLAGFFQTAQAHGRCAVVAVAVERHRLRRGSWPDSLAALVPDLLPAVPIDPFNGQPLYYRRTANGVVIYSVGTNGADDGGKLFEVHALSSGADLGVRLWDVPHRRQSPAPPPPSEPGR